MARLQSVNHNLTDQRIRVTLKGHNSLEMLQTCPSIGFGCWTCPDAGYSRDDDFARHVL